MKERLMTKGEFADFNSEMNRLKNIKWKSYTATLKEVGVTYLGSVAQRCCTHMSISSQHIVYIWLQPI